MDNGGNQRTGLTGNQTRVFFVLFFYLRIVSADVEEVKREDVVLGSHHESPLLLIQQEGVVSRAVGQAFECHKVVRLQHFCREKWKEKSHDQHNMMITLCKTQLAERNSLPPKKKIHQVETSLSYFVKFPAGLSKDAASVLERFQCFQPLKSLP